MISQPWSTNESSRGLLVFIDALTHSICPVWCPSVPLTFHDKMVLALNVMVVFLTFANGEQHSTVVLYLVFFSTKCFWLKCCQNVAHICLSSASVRSFPDQIIWLSQLFSAATLCCENLLNLLFISLVHLFLNKMQWPLSLLWLAACPQLYCLNGGSCIVGRHGPMCT